MILNDLFALKNVRYIAGRTFGLLRSIPNEAGTDYSFFSSLPPLSFGMSILYIGFVYKSTT